MKISTPCGKFLLLKLTTVMNFWVMKLLKLLFEHCICYLIFKLWSQLWYAQFINLTNCRLSANWLQSKSHDFRVCGSGHTWALESKPSSAKDPDWPRLQVRRRNDSGSQIDIEEILPHTRRMYSKWIYWAGQNLGPHDYKNLYFYNVIFEKLQKVLILNVSFIPLKAKFFIKVD